MNSKLTGAQIVVHTLKELGVDTVFGYTGSYILPVFDALLSSEIRVVVPTSEVVGAHAADGYSRASGKTGVVISTSGPGATNLVTGIATAYMDSIPMLAITANVPTFKLGKDSFQEVDITGIVTPITKYSHIVASIDELEYELKKAYALASSGRTAPALIDIPSDVLTAEAEYKSLPVPQYTLPKLDKSLVARAAELLSSAENPTILVGGGARGAGKEITLLAQKLNARIFTTLRGVGVVAESKNLFGSVGSTAPTQRNKLYDSGDVILALGTRFSDKLHSDKRRKKVIHVDIDEAELDKIVPAKIALCGDVKEVLPLLTAAVKPRPTTTTEQVGRPLPGRMNKLGKIIADADLTGVLLATDVGNHQVAVLHQIRNKPAEEILSSAGLGTMGYGLPAAIGGAIATGKPVLLVTGDGSFNMNSSALATAVAEGVDLTVIIADNHKLGMISDCQRTRFHARYTGIATPKISYPLLARSYGGTGSQVSLVKLPEAIKAKPNGIIIIEVKI